MLGFYIYTHLFDQHLLSVMDLFDSVFVTAKDLHFAIMTTFVSRLV